MEQARRRGLVAGALTPGDLLRLPQALTIRERLPESGGVSAMLGTAVDDAVETAIGQLEQMRVREGVHLRTDLDTRKALLSGLIARIATAANTGREELEARLLERARELAGALPIDQAALSQEVVRVAQRSDISEEVTRFHGHLAHWDALVRQRRAVRPQARFPAAGDEPRGEYDWIEGRRPAGLGGRDPGQGRARADARAGPECRVTAADRRR